MQALATKKMGVNYISNECWCYHLENKTYSFIIINGNAKLIQVSRMKLATDGNDLLKLKNKGSQNNI